MCQIRETYKLCRALELRTTALEWLCLLCNFRYVFHAQHHYTKKVVNVKRHNRTHLSTGTLFVCNFSWWYMADKYSFFFFLGHICSRGQTCTSKDHYCKATQENLIRPLWSYIEQYFTDTHNFLTNLFFIYKIQWLCHCSCGSWNACCSNNRILCQTNKIKKY